MANNPYIIGELIILPNLEWRNHYKVADWINANDYHAEFAIVITQEEEPDGQKVGKTLVALQPTTRKRLFYWKLYGLDKIEKEILDFAPER